MNDVQFEEGSPSRQSNKGGEEGTFVQYLQKKGLSKSSAKKMLLTVAVIAFLASLYFWFQIL